MMKKYYSLAWTDYDKKSGIAYAPESTPLAHDLANDLGNVDELPFEMVLKEGTLQDFLANSLAWPLMSEKMKLIIASILTGNEGIVWLKAKIRTQNELINYFIPRFTKILDVLDLDRTIFVDGTDHIIKPCFSLDKIKSFKMFYKPTISWKITPNLYISEDLKKALQKENLKGIVFEKTNVA